MESTGRPDQDRGGLSNMDGQVNVSSTPPSAGETKRLRKVRKFLRKYWIVIIPIILVVGGLVAWRLYDVNQDTKWSRATDYFGRAQYDKAAEELKGMSMPSDEKRLTVYAQTMLATRQLDKAMPAYSALYEKKKDPMFKIVIGNIYNEQKKYDEAVKIYKELIAANSTYTQAYVNLSTLYRLQNKPEEAVGVAKQGVTANPNNVVLHELLLSMLQDKKESQDFKDAYDALKKLNPNDPIFDSIEKK